MGFAYSYVADGENAAAMIRERAGKYLPGAP